MSIFLRVKNFLSGGPRVSAAHATIKKLTEKGTSKELKPKDLRQLSEARGITRRHAMRNIGLGISSGVVITSGLYGVANSFFEEKNEAVRFLKNIGARVVSLPGRNSDSKNDLIFIAQLHDNPLGEQYFWKEYHELFKMLVDLHKKGLLNRLYIEGLPIDREIKPFPKLNLRTEEVRKRLYSEPETFKSLLSAQSSNGNGKIINIEVLLKSIYPEINITGVEDPLNYEKEYIGYMDNVYQPLLKKLHPFLLALRSESVTNEQIPNADFLLPIYENKELVKVKVANEEFNAEELLKSIKDWVSAEAHIDEQSTLRENFILNTAKDGVVVMGLNHLENLEEKYKENPTGLEHSVHLAYPSGLDIEFLAKAALSLDQMKISIIEKITAWNNKSAI